MTETSRPTWDESRDRLATWAAFTGHAAVPQRYVEPDGFRLGKWVHNQRTAFRSRNRGQQTTLTDQRIAALERIPGWSWNTHTVPVRPRTLLPTAVFEEQVAPLVTLRAFTRWLGDKKGQPDFGSFTEDDVQTDSHYRSLRADEGIRASLAALVATGDIRAHRQTGEPLPWQEIVTAPHLDDRWRFQSNPTATTDRQIPVEVLDLYRLSATSG